MTVEPRVEELLANIRQAIDRDMKELDRRAAGKAAAQLPLRQTIHEPDLTPVSPPPPRQRNADGDIASLRQRVQRNRVEEPATLPTPGGPHLPMPGLEPRSPGVAAILSGQQSRAQVRYHPPQLPYVEVQPYAAPSTDQWPDQKTSESYYDDRQVVEHYPQPESQALMSVPATFATQASFDTLSDSVLAQLGGGARLEEMSREILRPMLQRWLDMNLPPMVERLVREEIERVARRGR